ncbi:Retrovirus-related Pol polyprotein from transposon 17.6 [Includes: Protease [Durusdinium trenchii]|uniref:Retrovirus-related Pol polyprotein from transposon 17.6 n=1 Tax=Durusdinium trenchii TaxID=1381693 RepID=A0ABP0HCQ6_9DINO
MKKKQQSGRDNGRADERRGIWSNRLGGHSDGSAGRAPLRERASDDNEQDELLSPLVDDDRQEVSKGGGQANEQGATEGMASQQDERMLKLETMVKSLLVKNQAIESKLHDAEQHSRKLEQEIAKAKAASQTAAAAAPVTPAPPINAVGSSSQASQSAAAAGSGGSGQPSTSGSAQTGSSDSGATRSPLLQSPGAVFAASLGGTSIGGGGAQQHALVVTPPTMPSLKSNFNDVDLLSWCHGFIDYVHQSQMIGAQPLPPRYGLGSQVVSQLVSKMEARGAMDDPNGSLATVTTETLDLNHIEEYLGLSMQSFASDCVFEEVVNAIVKRIPKIMGQKNVRPSGRIENLYAAVAEEARLKGFESWRQFFSALNPRSDTSRELTAAIKKEMRPTQLGVVVNRHFKQVDAKGPDDVLSFALRKAIDLFDELARWMQGASEHEDSDSKKENQGKRSQRGSNNKKDKGNKPQSEAPTVKEESQKSGDKDRYKKLPVVKGVGETCTNCGGDHPFMRKNTAPDAKRKFIANCPVKVDGTVFGKLANEYVQAQQSTGKSKGKGYRVQGKDAADRCYDVIPVKIYANNVAVNTHSSRRPAFEYSKCIADSGASNCFMPHRVLDKLDAALGLQHRESPRDTDPVTLETACGSVYKIKFAVTLEVTFDNGIGDSAARVRFLVPEREYAGEDLLFGNNFLVAAGLPCTWEMVASRLQNKHLDVETRVMTPLADHGATPTSVPSVHPADNSDEGHRHALARRVLARESGASQEFHESSGDSPGFKPLQHRLSLREDSLAEANADLDLVANQFELVPRQEDEIKDKLGAMVHEARACGLPEDRARQLHEVLIKNVGTFALGFAPGQPSWKVKPWVEPISAEGMAADALKQCSVNRRYPKEALDAMRELLDLLEGAGRIQRFGHQDRGPTDPIVVAPALMVPKGPPPSDGSPRKWRLAFDFRKYNQLVRFVPIAMDPVADVLQRIQSSEPLFFYHADAYKGFWQLPISPSSASICCLVTPLGNYLSRFVCQGSINAMTAFIGAIQETFSDMLYPAGPLHAYVDDLAAGFSDHDAWLLSLDNFLARAGERHLILHPDKFRPYVTKLPFLGCVLRPGGVIEPQPERMEFLRSLNPPRTCNDIAVVVGIVNYVRSHLPGVEVALQPLLDLKADLMRSSKKKDKRALLRASLQGHWSAEHDEAWHQLKLCISNYVALSYLTATDELCIMTDASIAGWSAVALACSPQEMEKAPEHRAYRPLGWIGKRFTPQQLKWTIPRKELFAVDAALASFSHLVYLSPLAHVYCDHLNLLFLVSQLGTGTGSRVVLAAVHRLAIRISHYPVRFHHLAGELNVLSDFGSRDAERDGYPISATARICKAPAMVVDSDSDSESDSEDEVEHTLDGHLYRYRRGFRPATIDTANILPEGSRRRRAPPSTAATAGGEDTDRHGATSSAAPPAEEEVAQPTQLQEEVGGPTMEPVPVNEHDIVHDHADRLSLGFTFDKARVAALRHHDFEFPSLAVIQQRQEAALDGATSPLEVAAHLPEGCPRSDVIRNNEGTLVINGHSTIVEEDLVRVRLKHGSRIWIPASDADLICRVIVIAHAGLFCHQGKAATWSTVSELFYIYKGAEFVAYLVENCLNCRSIHTRSLMPRPLAATLHPDRPGVAVAIDYHEVFNKNAVDRGRLIGTAVDTPYILVIIDLFSGLVKLYPTGRATSALAAGALLDYASIFGMPTTVLSDRGTHFTAALFKDLSELVGFDLPFTAPRSPWSNGVCERIGATLRNSLAALCSELRLEYKSFPKVLPLVTHFLNSRKLRRLNDECPMYLQSGISPRQPFAVVVGEEGQSSRVVAADLSESVQKRLEALSDEVARRRDAAHRSQAEFRAEWRERHNKRACVHPHQIQVGDYVLVRRVAGTGTELSFKWLGPHQVIEIEGNSLFKVKHLLTGKQFDTHAQNTLYYADSLLNVTQELKRQVAFDAYAYSIDSLGDIKRDQDDDFVVHVRFTGFEREDPINGYERLDLLYQSVPKLVRRRLRQLRKEVGGAELLDDIVQQLDPGMRL